ncbi:arginine deiminase-related protein [Mariniluteicoccus endophyticus]
MQAPSAVVMVRPHRFAPNPSTLIDNSFQRESDEPADVLATRAYAEVTALVDTLEEIGVRVHLFEDDSDLTPDSVFPNNWFSTHATGDIVLYPMTAENRRLERRPEVMLELRREYVVNSIVDYSVMEDSDAFLEGTGAMVFDHPNRIVYVCRSTRATERAVNTFTNDFRFELEMFDAVHGDEAIYHTNVMMSVGSEVALVGFDAMPDEVERAAVRARLEQTGHEIIELTDEQLENFVGNALEVQGTEARHLIMSKRAERHLTAEQRAVLEKYVVITSVDLPTIELAGGSARCMIAGVHLLPKMRPEG